jgi:acyl carrier protein
VKDATADPSTLQIWCRNQAHRAIVPERWFIVDAIPHNVRGKVDRAAVRRVLVESLPDVAFPPDAPMSGNVGKTAASDVAEGPDHVKANLVVAVSDAVKRAWTEVLDQHSFRSNLPWDQAGGDSLNTLRLWFRIEEILGTRLSLDAMKSDATPSELVDAIKRNIDLLGRKPPADAATDRQPTVFFMPPAEGDAPSLAQFRAGFGSNLRFVTIQYPSWREMIDGRGGFDLIVDAAIAQIRADRSGEHHFLAGYSFGGFVACEVARRLIESGSRIGFLGLIDSRVQPETASGRTNQTSPVKFGKLIRSVFLRPNRAFTIVWKRMRTWFWTTSPLRLLRLMGGFAMRFPPKATFVFHQQLIMQLRSNSRRGLVLKPLEVPTTLFLSDQNLSSRCAWNDIEAVQGAVSRVSGPPPTAPLSLSNVARENVALFPEVGEAGLSAYITLRDVHA